MLQSERHVNKMVLWPGYEGREEFSLHIKNVRSVRFVAKGGDVVATSPVVLRWFCDSLYELSNWVSAAPAFENNQNLFPSETLQALTGTVTGAVAVEDGLMSVACKKQPLKIGKYLKKYKGSVASRPLFYYLNGTLAG